MYNARYLTAYEILQLLYVDYGAFPFPSREALVDGLSLIHSHLARFGLEVHIGRNGITSKTECIFFPPPQFFTRANNTDMHLPLPSSTHDTPQLTYHSSITTSLDTNHTLLCPFSDESRESEHARTTREDAMYDTLPETEAINVADGCVTFCRTFKYLGSRITYNLRDDNDIDARLSAASRSMGALKEIWRNPHLDTYSKYLLFRAIPINLLLWGCETWSLRQTLLRRLEVFLHRNIRYILHISIIEVKDNHIRNEKIRRLFYNIPCIWNMIAARQLGFLGKVV
jgi:hypothetical protein